MVFARLPDDGRNEDSATPGAFARCRKAVLPCLRDVSKGQ